MLPLLKLSARRPDSFALESLQAVYFFVPLRGAGPGRSPTSTTWIAGIYADTNAPVVYSDSHEPRPRLGLARWTPLAGFRPAVPHPGRARLADEREDSVPPPLPPPM